MPTRREQELTAILDRLKAEADAQRVDRAALEREVILACASGGLGVSEARRYLGFFHERDQPPRHISFVNLGGFEITDSGDEAEPGRGFARPGGRELIAHMLLCSGLVVRDDCGQTWTEYRPPLDSDQVDSLHTPDVFVISYRNSGPHLEVAIVLVDQAMIKQARKRGGAERVILKVASSVRIEPGELDDGTRYDAVQSDLEILDVQVELGPEREQEPEAEPAPPPRRKRGRKRTT